MNDKLVCPYCHGTSVATYPAPGGGVCFKCGDSLYWNGTVWKCPSAEREWASAAETRGT